jgi:hypothetical protein
MAWPLQPLTADAAVTGRRWAARARTAPTRKGERAEMARRAADGQAMTDSATAVGWTDRGDGAAVGHALHLPRASGVAGPAPDGPAADGPARDGQYGQRHGLTNPADRGRPFGAWPLDRLGASLPAQPGMGMRCSRTVACWSAAGLRRRLPERGVGARVAPAFAEPSGTNPRRRSPRSLPNRLQAEERAAGARWDRKRPRPSPAVSRWRSDRLTRRPCAPRGRPATADKARASWVARSSRPWTPRARPAPPAAPEGPSAGTNFGLPRKLPLAMDRVGRRWRVWA